MVAGIYSCRRPFCRRTHVTPSRSIPSDALCFAAGRSVPAGVLQRSTWALSDRGSRFRRLLSLAGIRQAKSNAVTVIDGSYLDMLKVIMFSYLFWFVLTVIFFTGTTRISVFCMGYLVACFYFLLFGGELLLKPIKKILHYWDFLIAYNIFVITMKNILSILACGYINTLLVNHCWLIQLLSLACTIKEYNVIPKQDHI
ncbi:hypothetical protein CRUP_000972, partial [Coryphaenoides rupestris]